MPLLPHPFINLKKNVIFRLVEPSCRKFEANAIPSGRSQTQLPAPQLPHSTKMEVIKMEVATQERKLRRSPKGSRGSLISLLSLARVPVLIIVRARSPILPSISAVIKVFVFIELFYLPYHIFQSLKKYNQELEGIPFAVF